MSHVQEHYREGRTPRDAIVVGLAESARVITAAALIMVAVFASFILNGDPTIKQFGVGLSVAVIIDATLVRCLLVPATMALMGRAAWWIPRGLDQRHAAISVEGHGYFAERGAAAADGEPSRLRPHAQPRSRRHPHDAAARPPARGRRPARRTRPASRARTAAPAAARPPRAARRRSRADRRASRRGRPRRRPRAPSRPPPAARDAAAAAQLQAHERRRAAAERARRDAVSSIATGTSAPRGPRAAPRRRAPAPRTARSRSARARAGARAPPRRSRRRSRRAGSPRPAPTAARTAATRPASSPIPTLSFTHAKPAATAPRRLAPPRRRGPRLRSAR